MNMIQNPAETGAISLPIAEDQITSWKEVREKIFKLGPSNEEETIPFLTKTIMLLDKAISAKNGNEIYATQKVKDYFLNEFYPAAAKNLIQTKVFKKKEVLDMSNCILENLIMYYLTILQEDHTKMTEMFKFLVDPRNTYYKLNDQDEDGNAPV